MVLRILSLAGLLFMQFMASLINAQTNTEHIVVTGSYTPIPVNEIGNSYTIITEQDIKRRQSVLLSDLLRDVPGFAVSRSGTIGSQTQIRVRGAEANHVLVMIDGIEANNPVDGEFNFAHLITDNIERVEIIRGPQSSLYGSDALAGAINIITKKGKQSAIASGAIEIGAPKMAHANGNISIAGENYLYRLHGSYLDTIGTNISTEGNEKDGYDNITLSFAAENEATENLKLNIIYRYTDAMNEFDSGSPPKDANRATEIKQNYLSGQAKFSLSDHSWQHTLGMAVTNQESNNFYNNIKQADDTEGTRIRLNYHTNFYFNTNYFTYAKHTLTLGVDHEKELFKQNNTMSRNIIGTGLVAAYHVNLWQRLFLSANLRHDNNSDFKDATTYRATLAYQFPYSGTHFHASYGTGIKNPTFAERFGSFEGFIGNPDLKPEQSGSWDLGIEQVFRDGQASIDLTHFNSSLKDEINGFVSLPGGSFTASNRDRISKRQGIEISLRAQLMERTALSMAYTYLDSSEGGVREIRRPRHATSVNIDYTLPDEMTAFNLNVSFTGEQTDDDFSPLNTNMDPRRVTLSDYAVANIAIRHHISNKITLYGRIENFTDKRYQDVFGYQNPGISGIVGIKVVF